MYRQLVLLALLALTSCSPSDSSAIDEIKEWYFALSNPVPKTFLQAPLRVGDRLEISGDSLLVYNGFSQEKRKLPLADALALPDSTDAFTVEPGFGQTLRVNHFYNKELRHEWIFEPARTDLRRVADGELTGKSFYVGFPGEDSLKVYFDYGTAVRTRDRKENEYYVSSVAQTYIPRSRVMSRGVSYTYSSTFSPNLMRGFSFSRMIKFDRTGFDRHQYVYGRRDDGTLIASYVDDENGTYRRIDLPLRPAPSVLPKDVTTAEFAERISTGRITIDKSYPNVDSARVAYRYSEDYTRDGGLEYDELGEVEITLNEAGEFILFSRGRVVMLRKWRLSKDRSYLNLYDGSFYSQTYLPILAWDDDAVTFRMPLKVKTREPRGMELESYANLDAFVRVEAVVPATSSK